MTPKRLRMSPRVRVLGLGGANEDSSAASVSRYGPVRQLLGAPAPRIAALRAEIWKNAPPIDFKAPLDSLEIMEAVMRHFYFRALIEERMGAQADWNAVDSLMQKALAAAEKVARYRHAQLSAVRLAGDINAGNNDVTLDELLVTIKSEMVKLGPLIGLDPNQLLLFQGAENRSPVKVNGSEPAAISPLRRRSPGMGVSSA
jgi:hypothetical protein